MLLDFFTQPASAITLIVSVARLLARVCSRGSHSLDASTGTAVCHPVSDSGSDGWLCRESIRRLSCVGRLFLFVRPLRFSFFGSARADYARALQNVGALG